MERSTRLFITAEKHKRDREVISLNTTIDVFQTEVPLPPLAFASWQISVTLTEVFGLEWFALGRVVWPPCTDSLTGVLALLRIILGCDHVFVSGRLIDTLTFFEPVLTLRKRKKSEITQSAQVARLIPDYKVEFGAVPCVVPQILASLHVTSEHQAVGGEDF